VTCDGTYQVALLGGRNSKGSDASHNISYYIPGLEVLHQLLVLLLQSRIPVHLRKLAWLGWLKKWFRAQVGPAMPHTSLMSLF